MYDKENWVKLKVTDSMEAKIIKSKLEDSGIEVHLKHEAFGEIAAITVDGLGEVTVLVPRDKLRESKEILENS